MKSQYDHGIERDDRHRCRRYHSREGQMTTIEKANRFIRRLVEIGLKAKK
jgi:hypothetical protein